MTVKVCDHKIIYENYSSPANRDNMQYRVEHPPTQAQPIPGYDVYTVDEVNDMLTQLRNEFMEEIRRLRDHQTEGAGPD